jgi:hypothetical protein
MKEHLLLEKAYIYPLKKCKPEMSGCKFDHKNGYWIMEKSGEPVILSQANFGLSTKKCDLETGEDQKGE